jgi:esterase/lipase superfamily enzyme
MKFSDILHSNLIVVIGFLTISCANKGPQQLELMPAPDIYSVSSVDPFGDDDPATLIPYQGILYATDRLPVTDTGSAEHFYQNGRGHLLRLGIGKIGIGGQSLNWDEARRVSLLKERESNFALQVNSVEELGILENSYHDFVDSNRVPPASPEPGRQFAGLINEKLSTSRNKDVYIYTHGYKVVFESPLLVSTELWHFLGYDGVFVAFSWPSTPKNSAYIGDLETAAMSSRGLRLLIEFISTHTEAEKIHIIGYSAGTRVVVSALSQLAMLHAGQGPADLRIGHVILVASDVDRGTFGLSLNDGLLEVVDDITVYMSGHDKALALAKWVFTRQRLGQPWEPGTMTTSTIEYLRDNPSLIMVDASEAEGAATGKGHNYFRQSPWVSSDILMTLMFDLPPIGRGIELDQETALWSFPENYVERLTNKIESAARQGRVH